MLLVMHAYNPVYSSLESEVAGTLPGKQAKKSTGLGCSLHSKALG
jgi:hypothetical protein